MGVTLVDNLKYCVYSGNNGDIYHVIQHDNEFFICYKNQNRDVMRRFSCIDELKSWNREIGELVGGDFSEKRV
jgi:hypothetical protein